MTEVKGRLAEVEFSVEYADGSTARLPVVVKYATVKVGETVVEAFTADRGEIRPTGPGRYGVWLDPTKYTVHTWFKILWRISHPTRGVEALVPVDYFFRTLEDLPEPEAGIFPERTISEPGSTQEDRHLVAREIVRREALLLRRFNGSFAAFLLRRQSGERCSACWDSTLKRRMRSNCRTCFDTGFTGGYSKPYYGWLFHWDPARSLQLIPMGESKSQKGQDDWTTSYPLLNSATCSFWSTDLDGAS